MDFRLHKLTHLLALLGLIGTFVLFIGFPLFSVFYPLHTPTLYTPSMTAVQRISMELSLLFIQFLFVFTGMIVVPLFWYTFVNRITITEIFQRLQLRKKGLSNALLWGFLTVIFAFACTIAIGLLFMYITKTDPTKLSNIPDLQQLFSVPTLYLLVAVQPFCEEFFFRGFLFEKITKLSTPGVAVLVTSVLFGVSHLSYTYAYTSFIAVLLGILFAIVVLRTKNLFSSIFAHTLINIISLTLYFFGKSFGI